MTIVFLRRLVLSIKQRPLKAIGNVFLVYVTCWAILEPILGIVSSAQKYFSGESKFFVLLILSVLIGLYKAVLPKEISIQYENQNIKILFGDLFALNGIKAIPVSRYFFEIDVIPTSLQNKVIQGFVRNHEGSKGFAVYNSSLSLALEHEIFEEKYRETTKSLEKKYTLGSTAFLNFGSDIYALFALTETELKGYIPEDNCSVTKMWISLEIFWQKLRLNCREKPINIPLIGSGVTGIRLYPDQILELNLLAISNAIKQGGKISTEEIRIVLHHKYMENINLDNFKSIYS